MRYDSFDSNLGLSLPLNLTCNERKSNSHSIPQVLLTPTCFYFPFILWYFPFFAGLWARKKKSISEAWASKSNLSFICKNIKRFYTFHFLCYVMKNQHPSFMKSPNCWCKLEVKCGRRLFLLQRAPAARGCKGECRGANETTKVPDICCVLV